MKLTEAVQDGNEMLRCPARGRTKSRALNVSAQVLLLAWMDLEGAFVRIVTCLIALGCCESQQAGKEREGKAQEMWCSSKPGGLELFGLTCDAGWCLPGAQGIRFNEKNNRGWLDALRECPQLSHIS